MTGIFIIYSNDLRFVIYSLGEGAVLCWTPGTLPSFFFFFRTFRSEKKPKYPTQFWV